ncbi:hypothetical protein M0D21_22810 [Aquimarina sp. D1M17]|uniref:hypothetical protein n=1 Tax=Aquimarina acroporae TaxID=2937283 RepID=UPI0020BD7B5D|nr:hypothetical protein [Aquimarina acroporae]MCK8524422.1 hypothetical protein [Aquimarina acroporae]
MKNHKSFNKKLSLKKIKVCSLENLTSIKGGHGNGENGTGGNRTVGNGTGGTLPTNDDTLGTGSGGHHGCDKRYFY